ncbi:MFS transporter [Streptomyces sp. NPDC093252]|uniref:MFS transporter n=1 Tax=Streptomyces sp. NPDC093252 TaxID=3154980 RepID=UPI00341D0AAC
MGTGTAVPAAAPDREEHPAQRRVLVVLVVAQALSGAALAAGITVGALLAEEMFGSTGLAGVPSALFAVGAVIGAAVIGRACERRGRRTGLALGHGAGAFGSLGVVGATVLDSVPVLLAALLLYGVGTATVMLARYAGADLAAPARRARAVSTVLFATALGALAGPHLAGVTGDLALAWHLPRSAGPFLLAFAAFGSAAVFLVLFLRPDPLLLARSVPPASGPRAATACEPPPAAAEAAPAEEGFTTAGTGDRRAVVTGVAVMVLSQSVMIAIMTMTPIHMTDHGHSTRTAGVVIGLHLGAMYLASPLSGALADRLGRRATAALSAPTLCAAGMLAAFAPPHSAPALSLALVLLGVGWNLGFVSGTALIADALPAAHRASAQGTADLVVLAAAAAGGIGSGLVVVVGGYGLLAFAGGVVVLGLLPLFALPAAATGTGTGAADARQ